MAIDLTDAVRSAVAKFCDRLRATCPSAKWVRVEGMHVTLKFIGEVKEPLASQIPAALTGVRSPRAVDMEFAGTGFFPSAKRPRVLWVGMSSSANLVQIAADIQQCLEPLGISREDRDFKPHLTLARFESPQGLDALRREREFAGAIRFGTVHAGQFHLYRSELQRGGARYTRLLTFSFATEAA